MIVKGGVFFDTSYVPTTSWSEKKKYTSLEYIENITSAERVDGTFMVCIAGHQVRIMTTETYVRKMIDFWLEVHEFLKHKNHKTQLPQEGALFAPWSIEKKKKILI